MYMSWELWFDVGIKRYTTCFHPSSFSYLLWFDVGIKRYTTIGKSVASHLSCGLM